MIPNVKNLTAFINYTIENFDDFDVDKFIVKMGELYDKIVTEIELEYQNILKVLQEIDFGQIINESFEILQKIIDFLVEQFESLSAIDFMADMDEDGNPILDVLIEKEMKKIEVPGEITGEKAVNTEADQTDENPSWFDDDADFQQVFVSDREGHDTIFSNFDSMFDELNQPIIEDSKNLFNKFGNDIKEHMPKIVVRVKKAVDSSPPSVDVPLEYSDYQTETILDEGNSYWTDGWLTESEKMAKLGEDDLPVFSSEVEDYETKTHVEENSSDSWFSWW